MQEMDKARAGGRSPSERVTKGVSRAARAELAAIVAELDAAQAAGDRNVETVLAAVDRVIVIAAEDAELVAWLGEVREAMVATLRAAGGPAAGAGA